MLQIRYSTHHLRSRRTLEEKEHVRSTHAHITILYVWTSNFELLHLCLKKTMGEEGEKKPGFEESKYVHRKYERVPGLDEVDENDFVAVAKARDQWVRDR